MKKLTKFEAKQLIQVIMEYEGKEPHEAIASLLLRGYTLKSQVDLLDIETELNSHYGKSIEIATPSEIVNLVSWIRNNEYRVSSERKNHCNRFRNVA